MQHIQYRTGKNSLLVKMSIGFVLGILFGFTVAPIIDTYTAISNYVMPFLDLIGKIFLRLLTMIIVPLVFSSLVAGVASAEDTNTLGRIGAKTIMLYLITTIIALFIGIICAYIAHPDGINDISAALHPFTAQHVPFRDVILDMFPDNPVTSMMNTNMIQIIIFAIFIGVACFIAGESGKKFSEFFGKAAEIMYAITRIVMSLAPYGVFALISTTAANFGLSILAPFVKLIVAVYAGCFIQAAVVYSFMIMTFCHRSPLWFFRGIRGAAITAFVTHSSSVTVPVTLSNVRENFGVSKSISSFVIPVGATINMDGTAIYQVICAVFVARAFKIELSIGMYAAVLFTSLLASVGSVGVPGSGLLMLTMVLTSAGLPVEGVTFIAGIDVILSAVRTALNVVGDAAVCAVVSASEGEELTQDNSRDRM